MWLTLRGFFLAFAMFVAAGLAIAIRPNKVNIQHRPKLVLETIIPESFEDWHVDKSIFPIAPSPDLQAVIDSTYDQTLSRTYVNSKNQKVMLSIAYSGDFSDKSIQYHRPEVCYPSQGFELLSRTTGVFHSGFGDIPVTRLYTKSGFRYEPVTYWVVASGTRTSYGYSVRYIQLKSGLTGEMPDGLQVRFSSLNEDPIAAYTLHDEFANSLLRNMSSDNALKVAGTDAD